MGSSTCVFCDIVEGRGEASVVYEDDLCMAFMDIQPVNAGHLLVIPKRHAVELSDLSAGEWARVAEVGRLAGSSLATSGVRCEGVNLFLADGVAAGQEVFHAHLHVIPRFSKDGFGLRFPESYPVHPSRVDIDTVAEDIRGTLKSLTERAF